MHLNKKITPRQRMRLSVGAPPGTRTLGPLIKRNQEAIFVQINFYEDSSFCAYHRDFLGRSSLHPLHCLHLFASIIQLFNVQNMCRNVQGALRPVKARIPLNRTVNKKQSGTFKSDRCSKKPRILCTLFTR